MKTMTVAEFKADFSGVIDSVRQGKEVTVTYGRSKRPLGKFVPYRKASQPDYSIKLGTLEANGATYTMKNFDMTEEELLGL